jgi:hypothetical protein
MFIMSHCNVLHEFQLEKVHLRSGGWDDALSLTRIRGNEDWRNKQQDVMDVPLILSSVDLVGPKWWKDEFVDGLLWDDKTKMRGMKALRKASMKTKGMLGAGEEHLRRLLCRWLSISCPLHQAIQDVESRLKSAVSYYPSTNTTISFSRRKLVETVCAD